MLLRRFIYLLSLAVIPHVASADPSPTPQPRTTSTFNIPQAGVTFLTGDSWVQNGQTIRLYGLQSCIRGTTYTNEAGVKRDCGEVSLAYLAALVRDTKPSCTAIAQAGSPPVIQAVCIAHVGANALDLGTIVTSQGFGFAALAADGKPIYSPYLIAELSAKAARRGLWAASDMPHPQQVMNRALATKQNPLK